MRPRLPGCQGCSWTLAAARAAGSLENEPARFHLACSDAVCVAAGEALGMSADLEVWQVREVPH